MTTTLTMKCTFWWRWPLSHEHLRLAVFRLLPRRWWVPVMRRAVRWRIGDGRPRSMRGAKA